MAESDHEELRWQKSSFSSFTGCVEVAAVPDGVVVRDSKNPDMGRQFYSTHEWRAFLNGVRNGEFDHFLAAVEDDSTRS